MASLNIALPSQESQTELNLPRWEELLNDPELARFEGRIETDRTSVDRVPDLNG